MVKKEEHCFIGKIFSLATNRNCHLKGNIQKTCFLSNDIFGNFNIVTENYTNFSY